MKKMPSRYDLNKDRNDRYQQADRQQKENEAGVNPQRFMASLIGAMLAAAIGVFLIVKADLPTSIGVILVIASVVVIVYDAVMLSNQKIADLAPEEPIKPYDASYDLIEENVEIWIPDVKPLGRIYVVGGAFNKEEPVGNALIITDKSIWAVHVPIVKEEKTPAGMDPVEWIFLTKYDEIKAELDRMIAEMPLGQIVGICGGKRMIDRSGSWHFETDDAIDAIRFYQDQAQTSGYILKQKEDLEGLLAALQESISDQSMQ